MHGIFAATENNPKRIGRIGKAEVKTCDRRKNWNKGVIEERIKKNEGDRGTVKLGKNFE